MSAGLGTNTGSTFTQNWTATATGTATSTSITTATTLGTRGFVASDFTPALLTSQPSPAGRVEAGACTTASGICDNRGTMTVTFEHPVLNPRLHFAGIGGSARITDTGTGAIRQSDIHAILTLATPGVTLSKLSGANLAVNGGTTVTTLDDSTSADCSTAVSPNGPPNSRAVAGCGSVQVTAPTAVTSLTFNVSLSIIANPNASGGLTAAELNSLPTTGVPAADAFAILATTPQDYSDAPTSYNASDAPRHVLSDVRLGTTVTEENATVNNSTTSPNTTNNDTDDGIAAPITISTSATTYTQTVALSGASKAGFLAGWIDFNRNGVFDAGERAIASVAAGQTSATLTWSGLTGLTAGTAYARFRVGYDSTQVQSPTGPADSGEVEDWPITITQPPILNATKTFTGTTIDPNTGVRTANYTVTVANTGGAGTYGPLTDTANFGSGLTATGATWTASGTGAPPSGSSSGAGPYTLAPTGTAIAANTTHTFALAITYTGTTTSTTCSGPGTALYNSVSLPGDTNTADNAACGAPAAVTSSMTLNKTAALSTDADGDGRGDVGDVIRYSFLVTNTGNQTISNLAISDNVVSSVSCPTTTLAPGASTTCTATYTITQADVNAGATKVNTATATGTTSSGALSSPPSTATTNLDRRTTLTLDKSSNKVITDVDGNGPDAGDTVAFQFAVTNTGTVTMTGLTINDPEVPTYSCPTTTLAPGATVTCTATYTLTAADISAGQAVNTATASATPSGGAPVTSASDTETVPVPQPPVANPNTATTLQDVNVTVQPAGNDTPGPSGAALVPSSIRLLDPATGTYGTSVTIPGQGTYTVNTTTGVVTFDPLPTFTGQATAITYRIADTNGATATSTITITVTAVTPALAPDTQFTPYDTTTTVNVLANDRPGDPSAPLDPTSVRLLDPATGTYGTSVTIPGQGTYTVNPTTGAVTFDPLPTFTGQATAITYRVTDDNGTTATSTLTVTVGTPPSAVPDSATTIQDVNVTLNPLANDTASQGGTLTPSSVRLIDPVTGNPVTSVTVANVGTWTVDAAGQVTFDPVPTYTGTTTLDYRATDSNGAVLTSTMTVTVNPVTPTAVPDERQTAFNTPITVNVLANDSPGDASAPLVPTSVRLLDPATGTYGTSVTIPGEGSYTVNTTTGEVTFTPVNGFRGVATPVGYRVLDDNGTAATATLTISVDEPLPPTANPDTATTPQGIPVTLIPATNDTPGPTGAAIVPGSIRLFDPATGTYVTTLTVAGQGTYAVNTTTGEVTFTPVPSFTGNATTIAYRIEDTNGKTATSSIDITVTPVTPTAVNDTATTPYETPVDITVLANDTAGDPNVPLDPTTVRLFDPITGTFGPSVTIPGQGTFTVDTTTGVVTFTPVTGFTGDTTSVTYQVADANGTTTTAQIAVTVALPPAPVANPDSATTPQDINVTLPTLANDTTGADSVTFLPNTVQLLDPSTNTYVTTLVVAGQGTWTVDPATGDVTFDPIPSFTGTTTPVDYRVTDSTGQIATSNLTVTVTPITPTAADDSATTPSNTPVTLNVLGNDSEGAASAPLVPSSVVFTSPDATNGGKTLVVPGEGTYTIDPVTGAVTFAPDPTFSGQATPVDYQVADENGTTATATITVTVGAAPTAVPDTATTPQNVNVTVDPLTNDTAGNDGAGNAGTLDPTSVIFTGPAATDGGKTLVVPGEGTYTIDPTSGVVTFDPLPTFTGVATPVTYAVTDSFGNTVNSTITITVTAIAPVAVDDSGTTPYLTPVTINVLTNDSPGADTAPLVPSSVRLIDPTTGAAATTVTVAGEGTWTANADGTVTFTPVAGFSGPASPIDYRVADANGTIATATITVTVGAPPTAAPDTATTPQNVNVSVDPLTNDAAGNDGNGTVGTLDPTSVVFTSPDATNGGKTLVVAGQGTYTIDPTTGVVTFDPEPAFTGTATPVAYAVTDSFGNTANSTITITVTAITPVAVDDSDTTPYLTPVTINVLANDSAGADSAPLVPSSVRLIDPATGDPVTSLTVAGEGTWTANSDGSVTFTPAEGFSGIATSVDYQVADTNGTPVAATITVTVGAAPVALPDTNTTPQNVNVTVNPLGNDTPGDDGNGTAGTFDATSVVFTSPAATDGGKTLVVPGEGTYTIDPTTGVVTFDPEPAFTGVATPVAYAVTDSFGNTVSSTITITVTPITPTANDDVASTPANTPVTIDPLANDTAGADTAPLVPSSVIFTSPNATDGGKTLVVPGEGVWTIDPTTGAVTFTPEPTFEGQPTKPVEYQVTDANGTTATALITVNVGAAPVANPDATTTPQNVTVTIDPLTNDVPGEGATLDPASVVFTSPDATNGGKTLVVPGEGEWTIDPVTGVVTFDPAPGFTGVATVTYSVTDSDGNTAVSTITVTVTPITPTATDDSATTPYDTNVTLNVLSNDAEGAASAPLVPSSVIFTSPAATDGGKTLVVPGEGTYTINPTTGVVTFNPEPGFSGPTTPVDYQVADANGTTATATITITVGAAPTAAPDTATTPQNVNVSVDPLVNDTAGDDGAGNVGTLDATSVVFTSPDATNGGKTLVVAGEGTYTIDPTTGVVTFDPEPAFTGVATPVAYAVTDSFGNTVSSTITITVTAITPVAADDSATTPYLTPVTLTVLSNDTEGAASAPLVPSSVRLIDPATGDPVATLTVAGEGTWTANADGTVTFTPVAGFSGPVSPIDYQVADANGTIATATITVTVGAPPVATPDTATTPQNVNVTVDPLTNDAAGDDGAGTVGTLDATSVVFTSPDATDGGKTLVVAGQGTYTIDPTTGVVTFDPLPAFTGVATPVAYAVTDSFGNTANSTITITVTAITPVATDDSAATPYLTPVTINVLANDSAGADTAPLVASSVRLIDPTTGAAVTTVTVPGEGTWTANADGTVTFTPAEGFSGIATPVDYQVADANGTLATATISVTVGAAPVARPNTAATPLDTNVTVNPLGNDTPGDDGNGTAGTLDPTSVVFTSPDATDGGKTLVVAGEGTYTIDPATGAVTFDPLLTFSGVATPVTYAVTDSFGNTASSTITITVGAAPVANPDSATTAQNINVSINPLANDTAGEDGTGTAGTLDPTSVVFTSPDATDGGKTLVVAGEGTYTIDPTTGVVTFDPEPAFTGVATPVAYAVTDSFGNTATSTITITVGAVTPGAVNDAAATPFQTPVTVNVLANDNPGSGDAPLDPATVRIQDPATGAWVQTVTVDGVGTWVVNPDGTITFTPADGYTGKATINYQVADTNGTLTSAQLAVTVGAPPGARPDTASTPQNVNVSVNPLANDTAGEDGTGTSGTLDPTSVVFTSPNATNGSKTLVVPGEGTYTIDPTTGVVTFDPLPGFTGVATPVAYAVTDSFGNTATSTITVTVGATTPRAVNDAATTPFQTPVTVNVLANDLPGRADVPMDPSTVRIQDPATGAWVQTVTVDGVGTWVVNPDGTITFTPAHGFTGQATINYQVADTNGTLTSAQLVITVGNPPPIDTSGGSQPAPPADNGGSQPAPPPGAGTLPFTGSPALRLLGLAAALLVSGLVLVTRRRREE